MWCNWMVTNFVTITFLLPRYINYSRGLLWPVFFCSNTCLIGNTDRFFFFWNVKHLTFQNYISEPYTMILNITDFYKLLIFLLRLFQTMKLKSISNTSCRKLSCFWWKKINQMRPLDDPWEFFPVRRVLRKNNAFHFWLTVPLKCVRNTHAESA